MIGAAPVALRGPASVVTAGVTAGDFWAGPGQGKVAEEWNDLQGQEQGCCGVQSYAAVEM